MTKNVDYDKYSYSGYGIKFTLRTLSLFLNFEFGKTVITFGVENSSSTHTNNRKKDILILVERSTQ